MTANKKIPFFRLLKNVPFLQKVAGTLYGRKYARLQCSLLGMTFDSPVGVSAGIDKNGEYTDVVSCFSPSFIEIGPVRDVKLAIHNLKKRKSKIKVFANLSKNKDLQRNFSLIYDFVDGIILNVSKNSSVSEEIDHLLELRRYNDTYKPIIFKLSQDVDQSSLDEIAEFVLGSGIDAVMTGAESLTNVKEKTLGLVPVIVITEISSQERAALLLDSGADLLAVSNSPLYYGPKLVKQILKSLDKR